MMMLLQASGAELQLAGSVDVYCFAGVESKVPVSIRNSGNEQVNSDVSYRIFQASSATLAPLDGKKPVGEKRFDADEAITFSIPFKAPEVRTITRFVMKITAGEGELGSVRITVVPQRLFSQFAKDIEGSVELAEPEPLIGPILTDSGVLLSENSEAPEAKIAIVRLPNKTAEGEWNEGRAKTKEKVPTLFIVSPGVTGFEKLLPIKSTAREGNRFVVLQDWFLPEMKTDALSQLRLLRALQLLAKPGQELDPAKK